MSIAKRKVIQRQEAAPLTPEQRRVAKIRCEQLIEKIGGLVAKEPELAKKAASIVTRWLSRK